MGVELGETNLTLQGLGEEGGAVYFIRWGAGLLHAVRQVGLTGGIQQDAVWLSVEGDACKRRLRR